MEDKRMSKVGIIGLGYVGAPLAYLTASKGYKVIGIDNNTEAINNINNKKNVPEQLKNKIKNEIDLIATEDYSRLLEVDIIIICVPTPTKNNLPDLTTLKNVIKKMKSFIKRGCLIIVESTTAPGMTRKHVGDYLLETMHFKADDDYELAYCPERIDPGNYQNWVGNINRVCGGISDKSLNKAIKFYKSIINAKIIPMESIEEAELVKVWENSMRNISIAQANLLAIICDEYNFSVKKILEGLNSKIEQFKLSLSYPGIGPGGHCIPEDIHYLVETLRASSNIRTNLFEEAININENMPQYVYNKLLTQINKNGDKINSLKVLMLGISYKPNSNDIRRSQAIALYKLITKDNKNLSIYDPKVINKDICIINKSEVEKQINEAEIIILGCAHDQFLQIDYTKCRNVKYILDCWNMLNAEKIKKAGINYIGVGI